MRKKTIILGFLVSVALLAAPAADKKQNTSPSTRKTPAAKSKSSRTAQEQETLRGCVDQRDGNYVLTDDQMLNKVADLQAVSGGQEAVFAKHLGHTVIVKGNRSQESDSVVFRVASIEEVSEVCSPEPGSK